MNALSTQVNYKFDFRSRAHAELILRNKRIGRANELAKQEPILTAARNNLLDFTLLTYPNYQVNWHHQVLCNYLDQFANGKIKKLMIFMPPQNGKSELASRRFPAFLLGRNPNEKILACSHTADFSKRLNREVQRIIDNPIYHKIFPETNLNKSNVKNNSFGNYIRTSTMFEIVGYEGSYFCAGTGGAISGNPATILLLDDPIKGVEQAFSKTYREKAWMWFNMDFLSRRSHEDVPIIVIQTRWHEDDLSGKLLESDPSWTVVSFPAICEEPKHSDDPRQLGEPLWPDRFSLEELKSIKEKSGSYIFSALYQQKPQPAGGDFFKKENFRYYNVAYEGQPIYNLLEDNDVRHYTHNSLVIFITMDLATKTSEQNDYTAVATWGLTRDSDLILLDLLRTRVEGADHMNIVWQIYNKWEPHLMFIESTQYQISLVQQAIKQGLPAKELKAKGDKETRARALGIAAKIEAHKVFFPKNTEWLYNLENELVTFPNGEHDDIVDCFAYAGIQSINLHTFVMPKTNNMKQTNKSSIRQLLNHY